MRDFLTAAATNIRDISRVVVTIALICAVLWAVFYVGHYMGTPPTKLEDDTLFDPFQRAEGLLLIFLPLLTTIVGNWFGEAGKDKAEEKAGKAEEKADLAQRQLGAVLGSSSDSGLLETARKSYPEAFPKK